MLGGVKVRGRGGKDIPPWRRAAHTVYEKRADGVTFTGKVGVGLGEKVEVLISLGGRGTEQGGLARI